MAVAVTIFYEKGVLNINQAHSKWILYDSELSLMKDRNFVINCNWISKLVSVVIYTLQILKIRLFFCFLPLVAWRLLGNEY